MCRWTFGNVPPEPCIITLNIGAFDLFWIVPPEPCIITLNTELSTGADFEIKFKSIGYGNNYLVSGISKGDHSSRAFLMS